MAARALPIVGRWLRRFVRVFNGGFYHCVLFLYGSHYFNCSRSRLLCSLYTFRPGCGNRIAGRRRLNAWIARLGLGLRLCHLAVSFAVRI